MMCYYLNVHFEGQRVNYSVVMKYVILASLKNMFKLCHPENVFVCLLDSSSRLL